MTRPLLILPHGTGIGDFVNARPLLSAIAAHNSGQTIGVVGPPRQAWLLPAGATVDDLAVTRLWQRLPPDHPLASLLAPLDARVTGLLAQPAALLAVARAARRYLEGRGYAVVSLLEAFAALDLDTRWTPGPWSNSGVHLVDLLAQWLEENGIEVSDRVPRLDTAVRGRRGIILSPHAGSTLKELPLRLWSDVAGMLLRHGEEVTVLAAPGRGEADRIAARHANVAVLRAPLKALPGYLAAAAGIVSPDSGILHLAAAVGTPYVGLYGSTDPRLFGPYDRSLGTVVCRYLPHRDVCRRCWTAQMLPGARCAVYRPHTCLDAFDAGEVAEVTVRLLHPTSAVPVPFGDH